MKNKAVKMTIIHLLSEKYIEFSTSNSEERLPLNTEKDLSSIIWNFFNSKETKSKVSAKDFFSFMDEIYSIVAKNEKKTVIQDVWQKWCDSNESDFDAWLHKEMND